MAIHIVSTPDRPIAEHTPNNQIMETKVDAVQTDGEATEEQEFTFDLKPREFFQRGECMENAEGTKGAFFSSEAIEEFIDYVEDLEDMVEILKFNIERLEGRAETVPFEEVKRKLHQSL